MVRRSPSPVKTFRRAVREGDLTPEDLAPLLAGVRATWFVCGSAQFAAEPDEIDRRRGRTVGQCESRALRPERIARMTPPIPGASARPGSDCRMFFWSRVYGVASIPSVLPAAST